MDPQKLGLVGSAKALIALGRIPFASEVPLWTMFGCILSSQIFPSTVQPSPTFLANTFLRNLNWWAVLQCMLVTWGTNVAINYGNDYFDYDLDRPQQLESIRRDIAKRRKAAAEGKHENGHGTAAEGENGEGKEVINMDNPKAGGNTTRIIHDGTFPPWTALLLSFIWEGALVALILISRSFDSTVSSSTSKHETWLYTPFKGLALQIGIFCTFLAHSYVGPPLRLHYNGFGELVSALFLAPVAVVFGMVGHYTAVTGRAVHFADLFAGKQRLSPSGFTFDRQLWLLIVGIYCFEQARIFIMHIHDIEADIRGGKRTFVSRIGHRRARDFYAGFFALSMSCFTGFLYTLRPLEASSISSAEASSKHLDLFRRSGMFVRAGGKALSVPAAKAFVGVWFAFFTLVIGYAVLIAFMVYQACDDEIPENLAAAKVRRAQGKRGLLPSIDMHAALITVSVETLGTPLVLSLGAMLAGVAAGWAGRA